MSNSRAGTTQRWRTGTLNFGTQVKTDTGGVSMELKYSLLICKKASGAATAVSLPASPAIGDIAIVKDGNGDAATYNITITDPASYNIDGSASLVIAQNYGRVILVFNGTEWNVLASVTAALSVAGALTVTGLITANGGLTFGDGQNLASGTSTGTKIGTATSQKLGFWNATPIVQPAAALQGAVTDSTASSATGTIPAIRNDTTAHCASDAADGLHVLFGLVNAMRTALVNTGIMKGGA